MGELIMLLFHTRTATHVLHLKSRSYAQHMALDALYEGIVPLADSLAEAYQGQYGLIESYPAHYKPYSDALVMVEDVLAAVKTCRYRDVSAKDTHLQNIIDEVVALLNSTAYKLKFLK